MFYKIKRNLDVTISLILLVSQVLSSPPDVTSGRQTVQMHHGRASDTGNKTVRNSTSISANARNAERERNEFDKNGISEVRSFVSWLDKREMSRPNFKMSQLVHQKSDEIFPGRPFRLNGEDFSKNKNSETLIKNVPMLHYQKTANNNFQSDAAHQSSQPMDNNLNSVVQISDKSPPEEYPRIMFQDKLDILFPVRRAFKFGKRTVDENLMMDYWSDETEKRKTNFRFAHKKLRPTTGGFLGPHRRAFKLGKKSAKNKKIDSETQFDLQNKFVDRQDDYQLERRAFRFGKRSPNRWNLETRPPRFGKTISSRQRFKFGKRSVVDNVQSIDDDGEYIMSTKNDDLQPKLKDFGLKRAFKFGKRAFRLGWRKSDE